ncbi:hypothetical protein HMPREF9207_1613 [Cutibacterium acnes J165]|nr:hypothetical protein HMPREF0675_5157 [Cutibacterium acnes SK137]EFD02244.1 hypothetical protein HMPREF1034_0698 [Cutibacterium acnes SK187]EFD06951.1 hypothetical protein HMPREF9207_1613 [Cutibacterium acnes J165]EGR90984.1 conserved domain protein [Propionibacterium sp. CC003-HC2]EGR96538.1 conserved domain protein [Cutibacterium acnes SK182]
MLAATWGSVVGSVDGADPDEVAVGVGDHEGAAEHVVVRFLDDVYALRDPLSVGVIDRRGRPGDHESDLARAGRVAGGVPFARSRWRTAPRVSPRRRRSAGW